MKVLIVTPFYAKDGAFRGTSKHGGGVAIRYEQFALSLREAGHQVEVLSPDLDNVEVVQVHSIDEVREFNMSWENLVLVNSHIRNADVVVSPDSIALVILLTVCAWHNKPFVYNLHTDVVKLMEQWKVPSIMANFWEVMLRITSRLATGVYCVSKQQMGALNANGVCCHGFYLPVTWTPPAPSKAECAAARAWLMGGQHEAEALSNSGRTVLLLNVGRWNKEKRIERLVETLPDNCVLAIVGEGPYDCTKFHEPLRGVIVHKGFKPRAELAKLYTAADFLVTASDFETWGNVSYEANVCGTRSILQASGGHLDQIAPHALGAEPDDNGALVDFLRLDDYVRKSLNTAIKQMSEKAVPAAAVNAAIKRNIANAGGLEIEEVVQRAAKQPANGIMMRGISFLLLIPTLIIMWLGVWILSYLGVARVSIQNSQRRLPKLMFGFPVKIWAPGLLMVFSWLSLMIQWSSSSRGPTSHPGL